MLTCLVVVVHPMPSSPQICLHCKRSGRSGTRLHNCILLGLRSRSLESATQSRKDTLVAELWPNIHSAVQFRNRHVAQKRSCKMHVSSLPLLSVKRNASQMPMCKTMHVYEVLLYSYSQGNQGRGVSARRCRFCRKHYQVDACCAVVQY